MHIESAEGGVRPLPRAALPIGVNHSWNAELIFLFVPAESHHHIWRMWTVDLPLVESERPFHRFLCENHSGKI